MDFIRNVALIILLIIFVLALTMLASIVLVTVALSGPRAIIWTGDYLYDLKYYWSHFTYWWKFWWIYNDYPAKLAARGGSYMTGKLFGLTIAPTVIIGSLAFLLRAPLMDFRPYKKKESIHGDAHWATMKDIRKAGLRAKKGMLLGRDTKGKLLIAGGFQHTLLFAPTGSGKGVGFVIPNLLYWTDSIIVHDIKLENYELTSGWRANKLGQRTFLWCPADPDGVSHCYNPLDWVSKKSGQMVDDVQKIANLILPEQDFWENEARSLFVGVVLYLLAVPEKTKSFGEVVRTLRSDDVVYNLAVVLDTIGGYIHPVAYMNIASFLQKADKERSGVTSTLNSKLELWSNPLIDTATASSDFNISTFKQSPTTIYVGLTPDNLKRLQPLMQVFYQQASEFLSRKMPTKEDKHGVMFLMDEFPTLGKMEQFQTGIAYFRGYKVRLFLIIQDTEQLKGIYEESGMNSFLSNATYRVTFAANNVETANLISQLIGNKTVEQLSMNKPKFFDLNPASRSLHVSETQRALLLPQEVINLPREEQILLIEASPPIKSRKIKYFEESMFIKRLLPPIDVPTQEPYDPRKFAKPAAPPPPNNTDANSGGSMPQDALPAS
jgi:type IV secretion system protein VirD4